MTTTVSTLEMEVQPVVDGNALVADGSILRTPFGNAIQHTSSALIRSIITEFEGKGDVVISNGVIEDPKFFGTLALLTIQRDYVERGNDDLTLAFQQCMLADPTLMCIPGPEQMQREAAYGPIRSWLDGDYQFLRTYTTQTQSLAFETELEAMVDAKVHAEAGRVIKRISRMYQRLTLEERTVVMYLYAMHDHNLLMAMSLVANPRCTPAAYASGVVAALMLDSKVFSDVRAAETREAFSQYESDAAIARSYLRMAAGSNDDQLED
ncbi:MAG: hypothetical protein FGM32_11165 [Candidatus Kapabacteria bacterium]|nr:hypothetical protein [Candidatus Kapabacteria bacterium]